MTFPLSSGSGSTLPVPLDSFSGRQRVLGYAVNGIPLPTQPYLATAPTVQGSSVDTGNRFTLFFASPDSQTLALLSSGAIVTLQFLLADGRAPSATVQLASTLSGSTLLVDAVVLATTSVATANLPFVLLQQDGSTLMTNVFGEIPNDTKNKPILGLYDPVTHAAVAAQAGTTITDSTNSVVYAPLASSGGSGGGTLGQQPMSTSASVAIASDQSKLPTKAASGDFADGALTSVGTTTQTKATDGSTTAWSVIQLLKGIIDKLLNTLAVTQSGAWTVQPGNTANTTAWKVDNSGVTQPVSGTFWQTTQPVSIASIPTSQAGTIAPAASQPTITVANTDTAYTLSQQARRFLIQNNSTANVSVELDASTSTASVILLPSASWSDPIAVTSFHFLTASAVSINNSTTGIIVKGWL